MSEEDNFSDVTQEYAADGHNDFTSSDDEHPVRSTSKQRVRTKSRSSVGGGKLSRHGSRQSHPSDAGLAVFMDDSEQKIKEEEDELQAIQRTYSTVLIDLESDKSAEKFIDEYKKLYEALRESHKLQRYYMQRCSSFQADIKNNAQKVNLALHLSKEDREVIVSLNQQVKQAWTEVEIMSEKETAAKKSIQSLQQEVHVLMMMVESSLGIEELGMMAEKTYLERAELGAAFNDLRDELEFKELKLGEAHDRLKNKEELFHDEMKKREEKLNNLGDKNEQMTTKMEEMEINLKRLETLRQHMTSENNKLNAEAGLHNQQMTYAENEISRVKLKLEETLRLYSSQKLENQQKIKELNKLSEQLKKISLMNESHRHAIETLNFSLHLATCEITDTQKDLTRKSVECRVLREKMTQGNSARALCMSDKQDKERELAISKRIMHNTQLEVTAALDEMELLKKRINYYISMNETATRINVKVQKKNKEVESAMKLQQKTNDTLLAEINSMTVEMRTALTYINTLDNDKKKLYVKINQAMHMVGKLNDEIGTKENLMLTLDQVNRTIGNQLRNTKSSYVLMRNKWDSVKTDLHYSEIKNESLYLANQNYNKQSLTLAEDLLNKEKEIQMLNQTYDSLKQSMDKQTGELQDVNKRHAETKNEVREVVQWAEHLEKIACEKDGRIMELNADIEKLITQRNIISLQCVRKMEEIKFLRDKNSVLEDIVECGNKQYSMRLHENKQLKLQILSLFRQKKSVQNKVENLDNLKSKLGLANKQLVAAKARYRALEDEHPYNLHRWRHLESKEISRYEMIIKIHYLLKRLIMKSTEVTKLEGTIDQKNMTIEAMKKVLAQRPGIDDIRKIQAQVAGSRKLEKKIKAVLAESNLAQWQIDEDKKEKARLRDKLNFQQKKMVVLEKSKQKLSTITSRFPGIAQVVEKLPAKFEAGRVKNLPEIPKILPHILIT